MRRIFSGTPLLLLAFLLSGQTTVNPADVQIARDEYGLPHIHGKTDADAAYGLAWANAEDAFEIMQEALITSRSMRGRWKGKEGAPFDFFVQSIGARELAEKEWPGGFSPGFVRYVDGFVQGVNAFARTYPDRVVLKGLFPIKPTDVITAYIVSFSALCDVPGNLEAAVKGKRDTEEPFGVGSNAFALSSGRTADGQTYLCMNPHFMIEGPLSFYEAHISSDEGMNITGALFQGSGIIQMGNNKNLGWGMTYNYFDKCDIFRLRMHPHKKNQYAFDGEWRKLKRNPVWLKVKVGKGLVIPVKRMTWQSEYGPTFKSPAGMFYALRAPAFRNAHAMEAFFNMDRANNLNEFKTALSGAAIPMFNIVYADKAGNIGYVENGAMPHRNPSWDWSGLLPGDTSATCWTELYPFDSLPQVWNPNCGFVFNTNNSPFLATCEGENDDRNRLPAWVDGRPGNNNRAERLLEIVNGKAKFSFSEFQAIKFDYQFPLSSKFLKSIENLMHISPSSYPDIANELQLLQSWDKVADSNSVAAALFEVTLSKLFRKKHIGDAAFITGVSISEEEFIDNLKETRQDFIHNFGSAAVPLKKVHRFYRDGQDFATPGFPDLLMASYTRPSDGGKMKVEYGDSYMHFVAFGPDGPTRIETLLPFATHPNAGNYSSQLDLYSRHTCKKLDLDWENVLKTAVKVYSPKPAR